ncbi:MAG: kinase [Candidatus Marinimicrobia bacterium]|nr:kinase [Candidatus Neomarinimicrobiota bacterium]
MIISKTPYRISFFGGGTDYQEWYKKNGGQVISTTIDKYLYIFCKKLPKFFDYKYRFCYSKIEVVNRISDINHKAFKKILLYHKIKEGVDIHYNGELPARSGMASSSAFTVGLLNALYTLKKKQVTKKILAKKSIYFEQKILKEIVGCQDQIATSIGGFNIININRDSNFNILKIKNKRFLNNLNDSLFLVFTGINRTAQDIAKTYVKKLNNSKKKYMRDIENTTELAIKAIYRNNLFEFGKLLDENWQIKKKLSKIITNNSIDEIYNLGLKNGALGGKILGAGGGGFILFMVLEKDKEKFLNKFKNFTIIPFKFEDKGSQIILNDKEN